MIAIIIMTLVLAICIVTAIITKTIIIANFKSEVNDLRNKFNDSYQAYNEFQQIYSRLAGNFEAANKLYSESYKDIRETYTRLINLLQEYTSCLPENIRAELNKIEDRERQLKQLQNQILKDIENNPNYDDETKQNLKEEVLNCEI
jgi:biopolymer transport protein ExbB/TolQ